MKTTKQVRIVSTATSTAGLVTVVLTDGETTVMCEDMQFFEEEDLTSTFYEWIELAKDKETDSGCVLM